ncbi:MAG: hypothetical protein HXM46_09685 [Lautropia mirabilis]|nr:hypothetical protein [Lautropia mirabilis]
MEHPRPLHLGSSDRKDHRHAKSAAWCTGIHHHQPQRQPLRGAVPTSQRRLRVQARFLGPVQRTGFRQQPATSQAALHEVRRCGPQRSGAGHVCGL